MNKIYTMIAAMVLVIVSFGFAPAFADNDKPWICHPVEGKGETKTGWNLINPADASVHIDETTGAGKHTTKDGRTDVYAVDGVCPGSETPTPTPTPTPTDTVTPTPTPTEPEPTVPTPTTPVDECEGPNGEDLCEHETPEPTIAVTPTWTNKVECPVSELVVAPNDGYTFEVVPSRGSFVEIKFTAADGYVFENSPTYEVSDGGTSASALVMLITPRCPPEPPVTPETPEEKPDEPRGTPAKPEAPAAPAAPKPVAEPVAVPTAVDAGI